ncbi:C-C motif chemokine 26-like [Mustelus asterias]
MKQVLVVLICFSVFILLQAADPVSKARNCCRKYSKRIPDVKNIQDYKEQDPSCTKNAVLFKAKGKWICLNPKSKKVKQLVEKFSQKISG